MNRRLIVICAVMFLAALVVPAFAAVQNVKVSGDIQSSWITRNDFSLGQDTTYVATKDNENYLNSIARVRVDADLTDNVSTTLRLLNERDWNMEPTTTAGATGDTRIDLDLAYVTLKEMLYSPLTVVIGRQNLRYGNGLIIGDPDTNRTATSRSGVEARDLSARKAFDAVKMVLNYDPLTIDFIYSKINAGIIKSSSTVDANQDDADLYGVNMNYKLGDKYGTVAEAYFFSKIDKNTVASLLGLKPDIVNVLGLRGVTNPIKGLNLQGEVAYQSGNKPGAGDATLSDDNRLRRAWAWQIIGNYALQVEQLMKYAPMAGFEYTHLSGDKNPVATRNNNAHFNEWDPMFEDQAGGKIYNVLFRSTDDNIYNAHISAKPIEDVTARFDWTTLYLEKKLPGTAMTLYQTAGASALTAAMNGGKEKHLGQEYDLTVNYDYTEDVQFSLLTSAFLEGKAFNKNSGDKNATQAIASCKVTF